MFWAGLFIIIALFIGLLFGYGWGYDAGKKDGIRAKKASYRRKDMKNSFD